jgi:hypothetical protein
MKNKGDLEEFVGSSGDLPDGVRVELQQTEKKISADLLRSNKFFFAAFFSLTILGYFCSLSVCSQYSVAFTTLSVNVASILHQLPDPWCPIVCGIVFSILPTAGLFLFLDRFQRRRLVIRFWWLPVLTTFASCVLMSQLPVSLQHQGMHSSHHGLRHLHGDFEWLAWWMISAISIPVIFSLTAKFRASHSSQQNAENG